MAGKKKEIPFEAGLEALEKLVRDMEAGNLSLEDSLKAYEEGMALQQALSAQLEAAKARIEKLQGEPGEDGSYQAESFEVEDV